MPFRIGLKNGTDYVNDRNFPVGFLSFLYYFRY